MISVVIPAHNEEDVIARCLEAMTTGAAPGELDVVVVCNGCTDRTAEIARSFGTPVRVLETDTPSKSNALNLGDGAARGFPRFYADADIVLTLDAIRQTAAVLERGDALAAAPRMEVDLGRTSVPVRAFYRAWMSLPYFDEGMIGTGVYAMSERGRARFERFPDIIADDGYARLVFRPEERRTVRSVGFLVTPPTTLSGVIKIKTRARAGGMELAQKFPELLPHDTGGAGRSIRRMLSRPGLWACYVVYLYATARAKVAGRRKLRVADRRRAWERDNTSRRSARERGAPIA